MDLSIGYGPQHWLWTSALTVSTFMISFRCTSATAQTRAESKAAHRSADKMYC
eukprot:SAG31_NODE_24777_length_474_cov_0.946667_1_plen_52_part_10